MSRKRIVLNSSEVYDTIWSISATKAAKKFGVIYEPLKKECENAGIPLPTKSYWSKKSFGINCEKIPLPSNIPATINVEVHAVKIKPNTELSSDVEPTANQQNTIFEYLGDKRLQFLEPEYRKRVLEKAIQLKPAEAGIPIHSVLKRHLRDWKTWGKAHPRDEFACKKDAYRRAPAGEPALWVKVSENSLERLYSLLNSLFRAIESFGGKINPDLTMIIRGEHVTYSIKEIKEQVDHVLTKSEIKELEKFKKLKNPSPWDYPSEHRKYDHVPTGRLVIRFKDGTMFRDHNDQKLEDQLGDLLIALYEESENVRIDREEKEEKARQAEIARQKREQ